MDKAPEFMYRSNITSCTFDEKSDAVFDTQNTCIDNVFFALRKSHDNPVSITVESALEKKSEIIEACFNLIKALKNPEQFISKYSLKK